MNVFFFSILIFFLFLQGFSETLKELSCVVLEWMRRRSSVSGLTRRRPSALRSLSSLPRHVVLLLFLQAREESLLLPPLPQVIEKEHWLNPKFENFIVCFCFVSTLSSYQFILMS
jgi:hypothetical protein